MTQDGQALAELRRIAQESAAAHIDASYVTDDLAVLAVVERQRGLVGDLAEQDWSLRATLVFRRDDGQWRLVHRHADALVHPIGWRTLSQLARGGLAD